MDVRKSNQFQISKTFSPVTKDFFEGPTEDLGRRLLGCILVHEFEGELLAGRIVETEAYLGANDPAAHSYRGQTERTAAMFGPAGHAYIYFSYGVHYCLNVTAGPVGIGEGVLLRAIEPLTGIEIMRQKRPLAASYNLTNGPGKLVQAMGVSKQLYGHDLTEKPLYICHGSNKGEQVLAGPRVGISKAADLPLRFWFKDNQWVSGIRKK